MSADKLPTIRKWIAIICGVLFLALAIRSIYISNYLFALIFTWLGVGLLLKKPWANRGAAFVCLLAAFIFPLVEINPFTAGDLITENGEAPSVSQMLIWIIPLEVCLLCLVWLLDPPRNKKA